jgi:hypothetical protein
LGLRGLLLDQLGQPRRDPAGRRRRDRRNAPSLANIASLSTRSAGVLSYFRRDVAVVWVATAERVEIHRQSACSLPGGMGHGAYAHALRRGPAGLLVRVGSDDEGARALSRRDDLQTLPGGNDPAPADAARNQTTATSRWKSLSKSSTGSAPIMRSRGCLP